jgi:hypothetical protein
MREVLPGQGHLPVRDRRAYNIALERAEELSEMPAHKGQGNCT